jgi:hypothetical protein
MCGAMRRNARLPLLIALVFCTFAVASDGAVAEFQSGLYSHDDGGCASRVDPITFVFFAEATGWRTYNHIRAHTGWRGDTDANQFFASHGYCRQSYAEAYNGDSSETRYHVRLRQTAEWDDTYGYTTVATPHYELWADDCSWGGLPGHGVEEGSIDNPYDSWSGFDNGREIIWNFMAGTNAHWWQPATYWGNTAEMSQCGGRWYAGSNGKVYWLTIPAWAH